jgi:hypothetical protein
LFATRLATLLLLSGVFATLPDADGKIDHCPTVRLIVFCCCSFQALATYLGQVGLTSEAFNEFAKLSL